MFKNNYGGDDMSELVKKIRSFRVNNDLSLFDMAKSIGFSSAKLSQFECGNVEINVNEIDKILSFIGAPQLEWIGVDSPPANNEDVLCIKDSGFKQIDYYQNGRFQLSNDYIYWMVAPKLPTPPKDLK